MFAGVHGKMIRFAGNKVIYQGGYTGTTLNCKLGIFQEDFSLGDNFS